MIDFHSFWPSRVYFLYGGKISPRGHGVQFLGFPFARLCSTLRSIFCRVFSLNTIHRFAIVGTVGSLYAAHALAAVVTKPVIAASVLKKFRFALLYLTTTTAFHRMDSII
jgi:hypothetical protein